MTAGAAIDVDWSLQKRDFEPDGSLRDIYVLGTTPLEWNKVLAFLASGPFRAEFSRDGVVGPIPKSVEEVPNTGGALLLFWIGQIDIACHFFTPDEIEFDFVPNRVDEAALRQLLAFLVDIGDLTGKVAVLTPENSRDAPIFRYTPGG